MGISITKLETRTNIALPEGRSPPSEGIECERARGRLTLGCFGSIYPKKQNSFVVGVAAANWVFSVNSYLVANRCFDRDEEFGFATTPKGLTSF